MLFSHISPVSGMRGGGVNRRPSTWPKRRIFPTHAFESRANVSHRGHSALGQTWLLLKASWLTIRCRLVQPINQKIFHYFYEIHNFNIICLITFSTRKTYTKQIIKWKMHRHEKPTKVDWKRWRDENSFVWSTVLCNCNCSLWMLRSLFEFSPLLFI